MNIKTIGSVFLATLISGCAATQNRDETANAKAQQDAALVLLQKTAGSIERSLLQLAEAEQFEKMRLKPNEPRLIKTIPGMEAVVSMPWQGTVEQTILKLAGLCGYEVRFIGKTPVIPILVQIGREPATVSDHMRTVGAQAGQRADVIVDPKLKLIEVRYANGI